MKWKAKPVPREEDERLTLRFAWFPVRCTDGYWRWLCDVYPRQRWFSYRAGWVTIETRGAPGGQT